MLDDTLIVFLSDNGAPTVGQFANWGVNVSFRDSIVQDGESNNKEVLITIDDGEGNSFAAYKAGDYKVVVGNVTGLQNDYYGADFMMNIILPPDNYSSIRFCDLSKSILFMGKYLDYYEATKHCCW